MPRNDTGTKYFTIRIDASLLDAVRQIARAEHRSLNGQMLYFIEQSVAAAEPPRPDAADASAPPASKPPS